MRPSKELYRLIRELQEQGAEIRFSNKKHYKVYHKDILITSLAGTTSDVRSMKNARALLRRKGFEV